MPTKTVTHLTSVFNIPEIEDEVDYKKLYDKQKRLRIFYERKAKQLQAKLKNYMKDNKHVLGRNKQQDILNIIQEIKSFKCMLPNSVREIEMEVQSDNSIDQKNNYALIKEFAVYGVTEDDMRQADVGHKFEGNTILANKNVSQILEHTSKLVFPSGTYVNYYTGKQAYQKSLDIINISKEKLKSFILTFQPTSFEKKMYKPIVDGEKEKDYQVVINMLNPERRVYALCLALDDFSVIQYGKIAQQQMQKIDKKKSQKIVRFKEVEMSRSEQFKIGVSKRVYCIFSYYPFFSFFEQLLQNLLYSIKVERYIKFKQSGEDLQTIDSRCHSLMMIDRLQLLRTQGTQKPIILDRLIDFNLGPNNKIYLQLSRAGCQGYMAQDWSFSILSLFTLDIFMDVLTLMILQQKMIFVCSNPTILTYAIFLFTRVLMRPFQYPYPVVNLIPDQQQYLNAPFPIVYGCNKTKSQLLLNKTHKKYKNVYVFFEPSGVDIVSEDSKKKLLNNKSPRLRDMLISRFKKMQKNYPKSNLSLFNLIQKRQTEQFIYQQNKQLSKQIIDSVHNYMNNYIFKLLPSQKQVEEMRVYLSQEKKVSEDDLNQQIFAKIKQDYSPKSKDPFFAAFLQTQLLNVHIFKY